ncbi:uncharacterized protein LOC101053972 [Saimiri boliviensis]|uniref:uncharacterized protein LOC101053972 n=1 Tax=Saimiri boliviensis TaxID=27679 RepID=UPI003D783AA8
MEARLARTQVLTVGYLSMPHGCSWRMGEEWQRRLKTVFSTLSSVSFSDMKLKPGRRCVYFVRIFGEQMGGLFSAENRLFSALCQPDTWNLNPHENNGNKRKV